MNMQRYDKFPNTEIPGEGRGLSPEPGYPAPKMEEKQAVVLLVIGFGSFINGRFF